MSNLHHYTQIDKKKKKNSTILPDYKADVDMFNHIMDFTGPIPGSGISIAEDMSDDNMNSKAIYDAVLSNFKISSSPVEGACYILPSGEFVDPGRAHGNVDEFIVENFPEIDIIDYPNGYLVDAEQCVRLNDGKGMSFSSDRYITLPDLVTLDQIYAIENWLDHYSSDEITVSTVDGSMIVYDLKDGKERLINRLKKYHNMKVLSEGMNSVNESASYLDEEFTIRQLTFKGLTTEGWGVHHSFLIENNDSKRGGVIVLSPDVNSINLAKNDLIDWAKKKLSSVNNRITKKRLHKDLMSYDIPGVSVGNYFKGSYRGENNKVYNETSFAVELDNITNDLLQDIAKDLCKDFHQESVLVRYNDGSAPEYIKYNWNFDKDPISGKTWTYEEFIESNLPDLSNESIINEDDVGISSMFIDAINECWRMIDIYQGMITTLDALDRHEYDATLYSLLESRNKEVGALQGILELTTPAGDNIELGKDIAQDQLAFDSIKE